MQTLKTLLLALLHTVFIKTMRSSLLIAGVWMLMSNTGAWQYFSSSMLAHDVARTAHWSQFEATQAKVVVVAIDDAGYQGFFSAKSPLDRKLTKQLLDTIATSAPKAKRITLDLDLSPVPAQPNGQKMLDAYLLLDPKRWVLAAVNSGSEADIAAQKAWRERLCQQGISFGLPYVPHEFGYPKLIHQYENGLADMTLQPAGQCADPVDGFVQKAMPQSPAMLQTGLILPFSGDLNALAAMLQAVEPDWVVVGGAWGSTDVLATPFGDRFGVQIHAAALAGALEHQRVAPNGVQLVVAWLFVSVLSTVLTSMGAYLGRWFAPQTKAMAGHRFFLEILSPLIFILIAIGLLYALSEGLSVLHARTGYWLPSSIVASTAMSSVLFVWNLGRNVPVNHDGITAAWRTMVSNPIKADVYSIATAAKTVFTGVQPQAWGVVPPKVPVSRWRAAFEGLFALVSLVVQAAAPFGIVTYALLKPI